VVSIAGALLGWSPVIAADIEPGSVEVARANAACNSIELDVRQLDLLASAPPAAEAMVANLPLAVHESIAARLDETPSRLIASGVREDEAEDLIVCYFESAGLAVEEQRLEDGWVSALFAQLK
jgi:ribosomal protein L11 methylase PrmA